MQAEEEDELRQNANKICLADVQITLGDIERKETIGVFFLGECGRIICIGEMTQGQNGISAPPQGWERDPNQR